MKTASKNLFNSYRYKKSNHYFNIPHQSNERKFLLFTPGPVNVAENVRVAISKDDICHREINFEQLLQSIENKLLRLFEIKNTEDYRAVVITGSGTAANESILSSVVGDKNILIISNGEFGERLYGISKVHNKNTFLLKFDWGQRFDLGRIEEQIKKHNIDIAAMVHHETSSGMLNPLQETGSLLKSMKVKLIVDCVSSAGAESIDMEKCHIAFCSGSASKAIGSYPGLSFVIGAKNEFEKLKDLPVKSVYLNLYNFYKFISTNCQTPNTPAVPLFYALEQALTNILDEGVSHRYHQLKSKAEFLRKGMSELGLEFLIEQNDMCSILTTVKTPSYIEVNDLREKLHERSMIIYEGKGCFKNKVFQVGNIGEISYNDILYFLKSLREILYGFKNNARKNTSIN